MKIVKLTALLLLASFLVPLLFACTATETVLSDCPPYETHICPPCDCPPPVVYIQCDCPIIPDDPINEVMEMFLRIWDDTVNLFLRTVEIDRSQTQFIPYEDDSFFDRTYYLVTDSSFQSLEDIEEFLLRYTTERFLISRRWSVLDEEWGIFKEFDGRLYMNGMIIGYPFVQPSPRNIDFFTFTYFWNPAFPNRRGFEYFWQPNNPHEIRLLFSNEDYDPFFENPEGEAVLGAPFLRIDLTYEGGWKINGVSDVWESFLWWR